MKIKSIQLNNFRQFKRTKIDFSGDDNLPVTVILGDNTTGKTTLVRAFLWGLYRANAFSNNKILLNRDVSNAMLPNTEEKVMVAIRFEHNNHLYSVTTIETYRKFSDGTIKVLKPADTSVSIDGGIYLNSNEGDARIKEVLNEDLKEYFFFDGENNSIEKIASKKNLTEAVSDLIGIKELENIIEYFDKTKSSTVPNALKAKMKFTNPVEPENYIKEKEDIINNIDNNRKKIENCENEIESLKNLLIEKEKEIQQNIDVKEDQEKIAKAQKDFRRYMDDAKKDFKNVLSMFRSNNGDSILDLLFAYSYENSSIKKVLKESSFSTGKSLSHISEEAIDLLISRGHCLCGQKIEKDSDVYKHLIDAKQFMEPYNFGEYTKKFSNAEKFGLDKAKDYPQKLINASSEVISNILLIEKEKDKIKQIEDRLKDKPNVNDMIKDRDYMRDQISYREGIKKNAQDNIESLRKKLSVVEDKLNKLIKNDEYNKPFQRAFDYSENIFEYATKMMNKKKNETREKLEEIVNKVFLSMYHGKRKITIDEKFRAEAKLISGENLDKSTGLETVVNFAFVAGLMKLVKEKIAKEFGNDDEDNEYPLVLDAPFSSTDEKHIENICKALPLYCNQIIIVIMKKDFESARLALGNKIGKIYSFYKNSETYTEIKEGE